MNIYFKRILLFCLSIPVRITNPYLKCSMINDTKWINRTFLVFKGLNSITCLYRLEFHIRYITDELRSVLCENVDVFNRLKGMWLVFFASSRDEIRTYMCYLFLKTPFLDNDIAKIIMDYALQTKNKDFRYWITQNITMSFFSSQKGFTEDFYLKRKQLLKKIAEESGFCLKKYRKDNNQQFTLCIIMYVLEPTKKNSLARIVKMICDGLSDYIKDINIVSLDSYYISKEDVQLSTYMRYGRLSASSKERVNNIFFGKNIKIHYVGKDCYKKRFQDALSLISKINPDCILDISDELSPTSYIYQQYYPTVYLPMRDATSSSFFDYIVGPKWQIEECNKKYRAVDSEKIIDWVFPEYVPEKKGRYDRESFNISKQSFVILTIAKCSDVCNKDFQDRMAILLYENKSYVWLIVGDSAPVGMHQNHNELFVNGQIKELAYENNLYALCTICDVLLRTDTTGGSGSTAIAAMAGLPIVMTNYSCDCMRWLGKEYTNIDNYEKLFLEIKELYNNHNYYIKRKQEVLELVEKATDVSAKWKEFAEILRKCAKEKSISEKPKN